MMLGKLQKAHPTLLGHFAPAYLAGSNMLRAYLFFIYGNSPLLWLRFLSSCISIFYKLSFFNLHDNWFDYCYIRFSFLFSSKNGKLRTKQDLILVSDANLAENFFWDLINFVMCTLVSRVHMSFYALIKGYIVPGNQGTHDKLKRIVSPL